jgi:hypothetical protein
MNPAGSRESIAAAQTPAADYAIADGLFAILAARFDNAREAYALCKTFLKHKTYSREFILSLLEVARRSSPGSWELRCLATLMIEHQMLKLPLNNVEEFDHLFVKLNLKPSAGAAIQINASVLKEGYSTTDLRPFTREFRRRLGRLDRVHDLFNGGKVSDGALLDFLALARRECKLTVARYLFQPDEVVGRILEHVERSSGVKDFNHTQAFYVDGEAEEAVRRMAEPEAAILERLRAASDLYWVSDSTSSEINSLVEYPLDTVVLVVKPPGSDLEFEIKRAGRRGQNKLGVVYHRDGKEVHPSHRLDGGSMQWLLRWEMNGAAQLSRVYRLTHGTTPPMPQYLSRSSVRALPSGRGEAQILDYFTDPRAFGKSFPEMRGAMADAVRAFESENDSKALPLPGDLGRTVQFLGFVTPCQAILSGTTSFRLDRLRAYLSADGPDKYFREGLGVEYSLHDAKQMADEVLEEVLGVYQPPRAKYRGHEQYVSGAFAVAENRARADHNYLAAMEEAGRFWGTLMAVRGYSWGESFVARNVGLKSVWEGGEWKARIIFMDHDNLQMYGRETRNFHPEMALAGMTLDEEYFLGASNEEYTVEGSLQLLAEIYRVGDHVGSRGAVMFRRSLKDAYLRTHRALEVSMQLQRVFDKVFIKRIRDWDAFVGSYLAAKRRGAGLGRWRDEARKFLSARDYTQKLIGEYFKAVEDYSGFLERYSFLYTDKYLPLRRS